MSENGRAFRQAWIDGVKQHYPGEPKPGYISGWEFMSDWEQQAAEAVYGQVADFIKVSNGSTKKLSREQRGRFIAICWTAQIHRLIEDPKPSYTADWQDLPDWQQETDCDIFDAIERREQG